MTTLRFAFTRPDGGVSIVTAAPKEQLELVMGKMTKAKYRAHVRERSIPSDATKVVELPEDWQPPENRTFREAWALNGKAVSVDMGKARDIHRNRLRALRQPRLAALDVEYQRADEAGDINAKREIAEKKQALRDATTDPAIEAATTPEELASVMPEALAG